jgi:hypothetical protein
MLNPAAVPLPPMVQPPGAAAGASAADAADAGAPKPFGRPTPSAPPLQTAPAARAAPPPAAPPRAITPSHSARQELCGTYRRVIALARGHANGSVRQRCLDRRGTRSYTPFLPLPFPSQHHLLHALAGLQGAGAVGEDWPARLP